MGEWNRALAKSVMVSVAVKKNWGTVCPAHWEHKREGDEGLVSWGHGEDDAQLWDVSDVERDSVESIANIQFDKVHRPKSWVGQKYFA